MLNLCLVEGKIETFAKIFFFPAKTQWLSKSSRTPKMLGKVNISTQTVEFSSMETSFSQEPQQLLIFPKFKGGFIDLFTSAGFRIAFAVVMPLLRKQMDSQI